MKKATSVRSAVGFLPINGDANHDFSCFTKLHL